MRSPPAKRLYETAEVSPAAGGFTVTLDGRPARTPAGAPLAVPSQGLARAIAAEWAAQKGDLRPHTMPVTRLVGTAIDLVGPHRQRVVDNTVNCASTDLLCYRAAEPPALVERQRAVWEPLLDWAAEALRARLRVTTGVVPVAQPADALAALKRAVEALNDLELAALAAAAAATGSLIIALALAKGRIGAEAAWQAADLDDQYQSERWGEDGDDAARRHGRRRDLEAAAAVLAFARG